MRGKTLKVTFVLRIAIIILKKQHYLIGCLISQRTSSLHKTEVSWLHKDSPLKEFIFYVILLQPIYYRVILTVQRNASDTISNAEEGVAPEPRRKAPDEVVNSTIRDDDGVTGAARLCTRDSTNRASHTHSPLRSHSTSS